MRVGQGRDSGEIAAMARLNVKQRRLPAVVRVEAGGPHGDGLRLLREEQQLSVLANLRSGACAARETGETGETGRLAEWGGG